EELLISQEGEQLHDLEEADITKFTFTLVPVKSEEDEEKVQSSQLQNQTEERRESEPRSSSSTEQINRESDGEDCGGPEPARNTYPGIHLVMTRLLTLEKLRVRTVRMIEGDQGTSVRFKHNFFIYASMLLFNILEWIKVSWTDFMELRSR
ncbi:hypothetical protein LDENG_00250420, partial [Lucifuga dentata]